MNKKNQLPCYLSKTGSINLFLIYINIYRELLLFMDNSLSREEKISCIKEFLEKNENEKIINDLYLKYVNVKIKKHKKKEKTEKCDINNPKYIVLLDFLNQILVNIGKQKIKKLEDFRDIDREDIIIDANKILLDGDMGKILFEHFDKGACGWYRRKLTETYILSFLRYSCKMIGYSFEYYQKDVVTSVAGRNLRQTHIFYNII